MLQCHKLYLDLDLQLKATRESTSRSARSRLGASPGERPADSLRQGRGEVGCGGLTEALSRRDYLVSPAWFLRGISLSLETSLHDITLKVTANF
ncbi:hypothetical protein RRG08_066212 [Elysia crispata]|uniref:Uncharacterized protein n=1 Tax=Elysia crispata TaxID=231223 RepID=A0AAE1BF54_9GAST|nr:hypothetical protein RRG08_066212 [Elysia crispata]